MRCGVEVAQSGERRGHSFGGRLGGGGKQEKGEGSTELGRGGEMGYRRRVSEAPNPETTCGVVGRVMVRLGFSHRACGERS